MRFLRIHLVVALNSAQPEINLGAQAVCVIVVTRRAQEPVHQFIHQRLRRHAELSLESMHFSRRTQQACQLFWSADVCSGRGNVSELCLGAAMSFVRRWSARI
jgi:hypothetical protein